MEKNETDMVEVGDSAREMEEELEGEGRAGKEAGARVLTDRMLTLMERMSEYAYLGIGEVGMVYANQTYAYKVLETLKDRDLVAEFGTSLKKPRKAYYLRPRGYRLLAKSGRLRHKWRFLPQHFKPFIFNHRMACARAGLILRSHPLVRDYLPESLLWQRRKSEQEKLCDAEFIYKAGDAEAVRVGLEVELTLKNRERLFESLRELSNRKELDQVWWLCGDETIRRALAERISGLRWLAPQRHFLAGFDELMKAGHALELSDHEGTLYSIDPGRPTLPVQPESRVPEPEKAIPDDERRVYVAPAQAPAEPEPAPRWRPGSEEPYNRAFQKPDFDRKQRIKSWAASAVVLASVAGLAGGVWRWMPELRNLAAPPPAPKPRSTWRSRPIRNRPVQTGPWDIHELSLASHGPRYWLGLRLGDLGPDPCAITSASVCDDQGNVLQIQSFGRELVLSRFTWGTDFSFVAAASATRFLLIVDASGPGCGLRLPLEFR